MTNTGGTPAGWYYAPGDPEGTQRYWDGAQWIGEPQAQSQEPTPTAEPPAGSAPGYSAPPPSYQAPSTPGAPPVSVPPPGGYGSPGNRYSVGDAFNYGWTKFQQNVGSIILGALAVVGVLIVVNILWFVVVGGVASVGGDSGGGAVASLISFALFSLLLFLVTLIVQAGIIRVALDITYGREVEVKRIFSTDQLGQIVIASLIVSVLTGIGLFLCYVPGLVVFFFLQFTFPFLIDKQLPAVEAIKRSASLVNKNLGTLIGFYIAAFIAYFVGLLLCGIGVLIAAPVVLIATVYTYRTLQGEVVAA
ncbi:DUF2510 domain-containing protein [bacterium]|nr:DUF2510 domain-containing protein [bacterium]